MTDRQRHDTAVAFCCDRKFFPFAMFMIWQIAHHNPFRKFDFLISTQDDLDLPDWAKSWGIVIHRAGPVKVTMNLNQFQGSAAVLLKNMLARELASRYRRILYLDCDMFVEGGDINRLLEVDIGPHPIGAVLDAPFLYDADFRAEEYSRLGWPAAPYCNCGLQLIDTRAYVEQDVERRSFDVCRSSPQAIVFSDQSLTNIALRGKFAQLAPCWNWQWSHGLPLVALRYPVFLRHFIGVKKPDRDDTGQIDQRFKQAYRDFFSRFMPEQLSRLSPPCNPGPMGIGQISKLVLRLMMARPGASVSFARHADPYQAII